MKWFLLIGLCVFTGCASHEIYHEPTEAEINESADTVIRLQNQIQTNYLNEINK